MTTSSVPPYMDGLFMPATPVQQSNSGSVRNWLFISPEEALQDLLAGRAWETEKSLT